MRRTPGPHSRHDSLPVRANRPAQPGFGPDRPARGALPLGAKQTQFHSATRVLGASGGVRRCFAHRCASHKPNLAHGTAVPEASAGVGECLLYPCVANKPN